MVGAGLEPSPLLRRTTVGLLDQPWLTDSDDCGPINGMEWQGKPKYWNETCPSAALPQQIP
jgi:hypothetical protein